MLGSGSRNRRYLTKSNARQPEKVFYSTLSHISCLQKFCVYFPIPNKYEISQIHTTFAHNRNVYVIRSYGENIRTGRCSYAITYSNIWKLLIPLKRCTCSEAEMRIRTCYTFPIASWIKRYDTILLHSSHAQSARYAPKIRP